MSFQPMILEHFSQQNGIQFLEIFQESLARLLTKTIQALVGWVTNPMNQ